MRVKFTSENERKNFFHQILNENFKSWKEFSEYLEIDRKLFLEYRSGILTLPEEIFEKSINLLKKNKRKEFLKVIRKIDDNWGRIKGGKRNYLINKKIFDIGRKKAIDKLKSKVKKFNIQTPLSKDISYIVGLYIGDGFSNKYERHFLTQFIGNKSEQAYYESIVIKKIFSFTGLKPKIKQYNGNFIRINYYSKYLHDFFINRFKIKSGRKSHCVLIPNEILNSSEEIICSCIAGLYDAEGSLYFDRRKKYKEPYSVLEFHINNPNLGEQISNVFKKLKINHYTREKNNRIYIYGKNNLKKFLEKIKIKNDKLLEKIPQSYLSK